MTRISSITVKREDAAARTYIVAVREGGELQIATFEAKGTFFDFNRDIHPFVRYERIA